jgi:hypothetical protein
MQVKIEIDQVEEQIGDVNEFYLSDCDEESFVWVTMKDSHERELSVKISIDELKHAIRKITAK